MRRWGRRGEISWVLETLISLILIALCAYAMFAYIDKSTSGEGYFSRYHAADLSTIAELAAAPDADVTLRYDNIRHDLDLGFWFENGQVAVGRPVRTGSGSIGGDRQVTLPDQFTEPTGVTTGVYAKTSNYRPSSFDRPISLILTRRDGTLSVIDVERQKMECPIGEASVPLANARVWVELTGATIPTDNDDAIASVREVLTSANIPLSRDATDATILIRIERVVGTTTTLTAQPGDEVLVALACDMAQQLRTLTLEDVAFTLPSIAGQPATDKITITVTLTTDNEDRISPAQIGRAAAYAVLRRYRT